MSDEKSIETIIRHWRDLAYTCVLEIYEYRAEFRLYKIETHAKQVPEYAIAGRGGNYPTTAKIEDAAVWADGSVKWDGCSNFMIGEPTYSHACSRGELVNVGLVLARVWDLAQSKIEHAEFRHQAEAHLAEPSRKVAVSSTDADGNRIGLYQGEVCDAGTCTRPPGHDGPHSQFDGPRYPDELPMHVLEKGDK